ncbi:hypothetical protein LAh9_116 [Aeromonas phage LAh_9]|uniref:Uncharacterized protein n=4 Tax=Lahexavirus TaxID=2843411 RepID=A0A514A0U6_9CAUD|nr:hypothetical protein HWC29_gp143 [Aeromonas phage 4_4572]YP_009847220.1 hypothetical protein HWC30_gp046 [Aeromonas phage LAh_6]YP_009847443.1 hypothetical protein HWC31_gp105 [Aeromonas phage LAh_8]YP_009847598.1 hypothetical protein HWC32_gp117 [Aeromonas phage LAh_9]QDH46517.1 hypothetical protein LAh6_46 [Aeromonas phage LAh_6]QDH46753.1 hypothetical protein LAh8_104 [Aeromonas phage LAh_8]QDH46898.1 hypothetical protein LAh9_116 [Aeromonas phage LAh_9]QEG09043.1 hypothetical protein 
MAKIPSAPKASKFPKVIYDVLEDGDYPARIVRYVGLGTQDQPEFQGQKKDPAFKCSFAFELIDTDATGVDEDGNRIDPRPACQFGDFYLFPGAQRGKVYELCRVLDPTIERVPDDQNWFIERLGSIVNVEVGHYKTKAGDIRNKITKIGSVPTRFKSQVGEARLDLVGFDPYEDTPDMFQAYSKLFKFQRDILAEAYDAENIPFAGKEPAKQDEQKENASNSPSTNTSRATTTDSVEEDDDAPF